MAPVPGAEFFMLETEKIEHEDQREGQDKACVIQEQQQKTPMTQGGLVQVHQGRQVHLARTGQFYNGNEEPREGGSQHKEGQHRKGADYPVGKPLEGSRQLQGRFVYPALPG